MRGIDQAEPVDTALAAFGLVAERPVFETASLGIWPENWAAVEVFSRMTTQLIVGGMGGVIGLRYEALPLMLRVCGVKRADEADVVAGVQVMEREMVQLLNKQN